MTNEQLNEIEHNLGLDTGNTDITQRVEIVLKGHGVTIAGDYERSQSDTLVILRRGISVHWIDIDSIAAIGVSSQ